MGATVRLMLVLVLITPLALSACGDSPIVSPGAGKGSDAPRWLTFQVRAVTILADEGDGPDGKAEFQMYTIATDGESSAKLAYPGDGTVQVSVGDTVRLGKYALSVDTEALDDELVVYLLGVDLDEQSGVEQLATDAVLSLLVTAVAAAVTEGASLGLQLLAGFLMGESSSLLANWAREADVIGEHTIRLRRSAGWNAGPVRSLRTADGGLGIEYQVYLADQRYAPAPAPGAPSPTSRPQAKEPLPGGPWRWDQTSAGASKWVEDGSLVIKVSRPDTVRQYYLDQWIGDFRMRADVRQTGGARTSGFGLVFRHQDHKNCYRLTLTGHGEFEFGAEVDNKWHPFPGYRGKIGHDCIRAKGQWNTLELVAKGSTFTAYVNGCRVARVQDSAFGAGHVGLLVGTEADGASAQVEFAEVDLDQRSSETSPFWAGLGQGLRCAALVRCTQGTMAD